jgi:hypothetical protein
VENASPEDQDYELFKYRVDKSGPESKQEYTVSITVPQEITHDFQSDIIITHPTTNAKTRIPITFSDGHKTTIS